MRRSPCLELAAQVRGLASDPDNPLLRDVGTNVLAECVHILTSPGAITRTCWTRKAGPAEVPSLKDEFFSLEPFFGI